MNTPEHAQIAARARQLWQLNGSPAGRDTEFWLDAESELSKEQQQIEEQTASPTKKAARGGRAPRKSRP